MWRHSSVQVPLDPSSRLQLLPALFPPVQSPSGPYQSFTLEAWLERFDSHRERIRPILADTYGAGAARRWWVNWRVFLIASAEAFAYDSGRQWGISHYLFAPSQRARGGSRRGAPARGAPLQDVSSPPPDFAR